MTVYPMPEPGSIWQHHNGNLYRVLMVTNTETQNHEKYPITIVYENVHTGSKWSRKADHWCPSMTEVK